MQGVPRRLTAEFKTCFEHPVLLKVNGLEFYLSQEIEALDKQTQIF